MAARTRTHAPAQTTSARKKMSPKMAASKITASKIASKLVGSSKSGSKSASRTKSASASSSRGRSNQSRSSVSSRSGKNQAETKQGTLLIIGGREDKTSKEKRILREVAKLTGNGELVVASAATGLPGEVYQEYADLFKSLGVRKTTHLHIETGEEARRPENLEIIRRASTVFFTGGDQLRITTKIGGSPLVDALTELYQRGGTIAGTSAGAAMMGETMLLGGSSMDTTESHKVGNWMMAPGLGFVKDIIIDQHFGQRARIGRLLGAVALNPRVLGIGIDEDTSIMVRGRRIQVLGTNAVYIVDGHDVTYTNIAESEAERTMSLHDVKVHILSDGEFFDLNDRRPRFREEVADRIVENGHEVPLLN